MSRKSLQNCGALERWINKTTYEAYLEQHGVLTYTNVGTSMLPLLKQGRDLFTIQKKTDQRCKKYDVVLYRRPPDQYVLHRIVEVREKEYVILGDNCMHKEYGITDADILGVMAGFVRKGKVHSAEEHGYRLYARVWYALYPLRKWIWRLKAICCHIVRRHK